MTTPKRLLGVHPSRPCGYTHHDAHAAFRSKSMRRSRSTSKRSYARVSTDSSARWARPAASGSSRITPRATRGRWGPRPSGSAAARRVTVSFGGIPTYRVGSRSRSTRDSRASFLATVTGDRASGGVFRVFSRIVRSRSFAPRCAPAFSCPPRVSSAPLPRDTSDSYLPARPQFSPGPTCTPFSATAPVRTVMPSLSGTSTRRRAAEMVRSM